MSDERQSGSLAFLSERLYDCARPAGSLKRKLGEAIPASKRTHTTYPSPPMSSPPSPSRPSPRLPESIRVDSRTETTGTSLPPSSSGHALAPSYSVEHFPGTSSCDYTPTRVPNLAPPSDDAQPPSGSASALSSGQNVFSVDPGLASGPASIGATPTRSGRKAKAHVASACTNCKRAHLSCDTQRPCTRCVTSGKQDSCFDVPHKKRGRPRLREENEFKAGSTILEQPGQAPMPMTPVVTESSTARPIARTRHQRTESLRSLRSYTSEGSSGSSLPTPGFPPTLQPGWVYQPPRPPSSGLSAALVPTAFLDLDLNFIRANRPFLQILSGDQDVRGRRLEDLVAAADGDSFMILRGRLKGERETREPAYMPPMLQAGEDPIQGVLEHDAERLASGFSDQTYTWTRAVPAPQRETFPVRVRLAKAAAYFVLITLPSFRPVEMPPPQPVASLPPPGFMIPPPRPPMLPSQPLEPGIEGPFASPRAYYPKPSPIASMPQPSVQASQTLQGRIYSSVQPHILGQPYAATPQQPPPPITPRLPATEPPMQITPVTPLTAAPRQAAPLAPAMQLPPIAATPTSQAPAPPAGSSGAAEAQQPPSDDDEESPKKRRRMDISDVLQR